MHQSLAIQRQPLAGNLVSELVLESLKSSNVKLVPHYLVKSKTAVEANTPSTASLRFVEDAHCSLLQI